MKYIILISLLVSQVALPETKHISASNLVEKTFELVYEELDEPRRPLDLVLSESSALNRYIGSWPPRFASEQERHKVYELWKNLLADAVSHHQHAPDDMRTMLALSELYRQGHNLDVRGAAEKANETIQACITKDRSYLPCHFSASYFYLAIGVDYIDYAESSLRALRKHYGVYKNPEVERGYAFLFVYKQDVEGALDHIDKYFAAFGNNAPQSEFFKALQEDLMKDRTINQVTIPQTKITKITTLEEFSYFTLNYYRAPQAELIESAIQFVGDAKFVHDRNAQVPLVAAFTCIFADTDKKQRKKWSKIVSKLQPPALGLLQQALEMTPKEMLSRTPPSPSKNDMNWACYFMTGDENYLNNIIDALRYMEERRDLNLFMTAASAKWSLSSNAQTHQTVREAVETLKSEGDNVLKQHAEDILIKPPHQIQQDSIVVVKEQKKKGVW